MNRVELTGRFVDDPEKVSDTVLRFKLAVRRRWKNGEGKYDADFIECRAFSSTAGFIGDNFHKGDPVAVTGRIRTGSYEKDGKTVYTTDVVVEDAEFVGEKRED